VGDMDRPDACFRAQNNGFVALVDGAFADAARRSGPHLLCRPGCTQCCIGAFAIGPADALRLRQGLAALERSDPERAARIQQRADASWSRLANQFPGDARSGILNADADGEHLKNFEDSFEEFGNHEPCPALDLEHGTCDLYGSRPQTCRVFGPPIATGEGYGICELCFTAQLQSKSHARRSILLPKSCPPLSTRRQLPQESGLAPRSSPSSSSR
jgi:Fe-S-cluster containining protein